MGVKYLPCRSIGYDHIPLDTAKRLGMRVSHSHYPPEGVANYTIMLMLMATRKMNQIMLRAAAQDYSLPGKMGHDLSGCTVGVIGTGKIGSTVIRHLSGFGCMILAYDLYPSDAVRPYADYVPLEELYARSDVITLHLLQGLESGKLGGAGLDVVEDENGICYYNRCGEALPNRELNLLRSYPNVIISPHTAFYTDVNVASMVQSAFEAVADFAAGRPNPCEVRL